LFKKGETTLRPKLTHLLRGAPPVRSWSKYQETVPTWTLCGIARSRALDGADSTEDASLVSCPYCRELMQPRTLIPAR
jgi:hypothetical protein